MNLERKSQAGNSAIQIAAYTSGCWVDSKAVIAGDLALNRLLRAGIRLNHKRVTYQAQPLQMQTDSASQSVSLGGGGVPANAFDQFRHSVLSGPPGVEAADPQNWAESIDALLKMAETNPEECETVSRAFLVISLVLVQTASRELPKLRNYMANTLPVICVSAAGLSQMPVFIMSDRFCTNRKVAFRPETTPTKSIVLVTVACATAGGELKRIHSTGAALRLAFYGMALVSLTTSATKYLGVHLSTF